MDKITNHEQIATDYVITYLKEVENLSSLTNLSGARWQTIEDCIWYILSNLNIDTASGYWLDLLGERVGRTREAYVAPSNLFVFDQYVGEGTDPNNTGFGQSFNDGLGGILLEGFNISGNAVSSLQDELYRLVIKFSMIKNNFDAKRSTIINAIKILTNCTKVLFKEVDTLKADITVNNNIPLEYRAYIKSLVAEIMPQCVELNNMYISDSSLPFLLDSETQGLDYGLMDFAI